MGCGRERERAKEEEKVLETTVVSRNIAPPGQTATHTFVRFVNATCHLRPPPCTKCRGNYSRVFSSSRPSRPQHFLPSSPLVEREEISHVARRDLRYHSSRCYGEKKRKGKQTNNGDSQMAGVRVNGKRSSRSSSSRLGNGMADV